VSGTIPTLYLPFLRIFSILAVSIGDRIAQLIVIKIAELDCAQEKRHLSSSARGDCGFGSTGIKTEKKKRARLSEDEPMEQTDDTEYEPSESSSSERSDTSAGNESTAESTETEQDESSSSSANSSSD